MSAAWMAKVKAPSGTVFLVPGWKWVPAKGSGPAARALAALAQAATAHYEYSPAHGRPGVKAAQMAAKAVGGTASFPPEEPPEPDALY